MMDGLMIPIIGVLFFGGYTIYALINGSSFFAVAMSAFFTLFWIRALMKNMRNRNNDA